MEKFNQLLHGIYYLRDFIPLNLFMLDNRIVNRVLEKLVRELKNFVTNYFVTLNQVENRRMCDEFEEMSINSGKIVILFWSSFRAQQSQNIYFGMFHYII